MDYGTYTPTTMYTSSFHNFPSARGITAWFTPDSGVLSVNARYLHWGQVKFTYSLSQNSVFRVSVYKPSLYLKSKENSKYCKA